MGVGKEYIIVYKLDSYRSREEISERSIDEISKFAKNETSDIFRIIPPLARVAMRSLLLRYTETRS